jgi:superfamily II DNA helicase RecQ
MEINTSLSSIEAKYGFHFKEKQLSAIKSIVEGNDTFVVLPTGYGKSKIYMHLPEIF